LASMISTTSLTPPRPSSSPTRRSSDLGALPEIFPEARTRVSRAAKAAAKAAAQESTEVMAVEAAEPEIETALQESPQTDEIPAEDPGEPITVGNEPEGIEAAYNVTGVRRKELVAAVGDFIGAK